MQAYLCLGVCVCKHNLSLLFILYEGIHGRGVALLKHFLAAAVDHMCLLLRRHAYLILQGQVTGRTVRALHVSLVGQTVHILTDQAAPSAALNLLKFVQVGNLGIQIH